MQGLAVASSLDDALHHEILGDQKGQMLGHPPGHHGRVHHEARGNFLVQHQNGIRSEERFRDA